MTVQSLATRCLRNTWNQWDDGSVSVVEGLPADAACLFDLSEDDMKEVEKRLEAAEDRGDLVADENESELDKAVDIVITYLAKTGWFAQR